MKKIAVLKTYKVPDPGTNYVRWVKALPLSSLYVEDLDPAENVTLTYHEGRRQRLGFFSERKVEFIIDEESDDKDSEEFIREIYDLALEDVADMMGTTKEHLIQSLQFYNQKKSMM